jgi:RNA polymerase sigma-70 factor (ECF subfamily)
MLNIRKKAAANQEVSASADQEPASQHAEQQTAAEFLRRLQQGDEDAWKKLTAELSPRLYKYLRGKLPTSEDTEDVLNETWIATVGSIVNFDGRVSISTYIYSIANRKAADFWRKRKDVDTLHPDAVTTAGPDSASIEFQEALNQLPERSREALLLRYHMGMSVNEVAEILESSYKATESLLSRARRQLQAVLENADL